MKDIFKRKEIWIGALILVAGIIIICIKMKPKKEAVDIVDDEIVEVSVGSSSRYVKLFITGELSIKELVLEVPYGYSYGNIVPVLKNYTNDYSILQADFSTRYLEDTSIVIASSDEHSKEEVASIADKININTASRDILISLYGIGEKRADKIIGYRSSKKITSFEELKGVIGVSNEIISRIKEKAVL